MNQLLNAFSPGSDLWVISDIESSWWAQHLDWKLNFQIAKSQTRKNTQVSENILNILKACNLEIPKKASLDSRLLIESKNLLPNRWVLLYDLNWNDSSSLSELVKVWQQMKKPSLRVFLNKNISQHQAVIAWQKQCSDKNCEIEFIEDPKNGG